MPSSDIPLLSMMKSKLSYMSERQGVLAQNIANADTPQYKAKDVAKPDFNSMASAAQNLQLRTTNSKHVTGASAGAGTYEVTKRATTNELKPNGNNVSIEEEMANVSDNQAEYQKVLNMYKKTMDMFKIAIGKSSGS
jgi:flagellar basal-body rod protein FlgB